MSSSATINNYIRICVGCVLLVAGAWGSVYAVKVGRAQALYYHAKYGAGRGDIDGMLRDCERAYQLYPHNYYFSYYITDQSLNAARSATNAVDFERYFKAAKYWCDTGLRQNDYREEINRMKVWLLEEDGDLEGAITHWAAFVDKEFWNPDHHAVLADLYLRARDLENARSEVVWAKRSNRHKELQERLKALEKWYASRDL